MKIYKNGEIAKSIYDLNINFKLIILIIISVMIQFISNYYFHFAMIILILFFYKAAGFGLKEIFKDIKFLILLFGFGFAICLIFGNVSYKELFSLFLKMIIMFSAFSIFIRTVDLQKTLFNMRKFIPYKILFIIALSIRFIPIMINELHNIILIQKLRGCKFNLTYFLTGKPVVSIIIPFLVRCIKISDELSIYAAAKKFGYYNSRTYLYDSKKFQEYIENYD